MQNKWNYLISRFKRELQYQLQQGPNFKSKWSLFKRMEFMTDHFKAAIENKSKRRQIARNASLSPLKVEYYSRLLGEVQIRPAVWNPMVASRSEVNQSWLDIGNAIEKLSKSLK